MRLALADSERCAGLDDGAGRHSATTGRRALWHWDLGAVIQAVHWTCSPAGCCANATKAAYASALERRIYMGPRTRVSWLAPFRWYLCRLQLPLLLHLLLSTLQCPPAQAPAGSVSAGRPSASLTGSAAGAMPASACCCAPDELICSGSGACLLTQRRPPAGGAQHAGHLPIPLRSANRGMHKPEACYHQSAQPCLWTGNAQATSLAGRVAFPNHVYGSQIWEYMMRPVLPGAQMDPHRCQGRVGQAIPHNKGGPNNGHDHQSC